MGTVSNPVPCRATSEQPDFQGEGAEFPGYSYALILLNGLKQRRHRLVKHDSFFQILLHIPENQRRPFPGLEPLPDVSHQVFVSGSL